MAALVLVLCFLWVPAAINPAPVAAPGAGVPARTPNPHRHPSGEDFSQIKPEIKIIPATVPTVGTKENMIGNKARTFRFFTVTSTEGFERIFFEDRRANKIYEIE